ncbi:MAG: Hpt domain-containing protein, partial [Lentisphaeraceae bacterium]|nr:Hpt domain-containing protein [Lentisphaeraceae bacterium]
MFDDSIDPSILAEFIDESMDSLEALPQLFIEMEKNPQDSEVINAIFRPVHSIKGNSAFFGMLKLKNLTHEMETTLDLCRKNELIPNQYIIDILLKGLDEVVSILERIRAGSSEVEDEEFFNSLVDDVKKSQLIEHAEEISLPDFSEITANISRVIDSGLLDGNEEKFLLESSLKMIQKLYCPLTFENNSEPESINSNGDLYTEILNWMSRPLEESLEEDECDELTELLKSLESKIEIDAAKEIYVKLMEDYQTFIGTVGFDDLLKDLTAEKIEKLQILQPLVNKQDKFLVTEDERGPALEAEALIPLEEVIEAPAETVEKVNDKETQETKSSKTMRVPEDTIDEFLTFVGELVVVREMYDHLRLHFEEQGVRAELTTELRRYTDNFRQVSGELERTCMNIRKQPIRLILQKIPRIVRDVASACDKKINVEIIGDDISVDKSLIGVLEAPLVHMTRNAADHGIETVDERLSSGKDESGTIKIAVSEDDESLFLNISDNGKGLDFEALRQKGVSMGVFDESEKPSEQEISQIIFKSGVSTAAAVT